MKIDEMKELELNILRAFHQVCVEKGIRYSLSSGTLLGAVRHKGFIPWDDDIDVMLERKEYERFIREGQDFLPANFFIQTYETDPLYPLNFCKIRDRNTFVKDERTAQLKMVHGISIDLFPVDRLPKHSFLQKIQQRVLLFIMAIKFCCTKEWGRTSKILWARKWTPFFHVICKRIGTNRLNRMETALRTFWNEKGTKETLADQTVVEKLILPERWKMPIHLFDSYDVILFEGEFFHTIKNWDCYLSQMYGDYMTPPPEAERGSTHRYCEETL